MLISWLQSPCTVILEPKKIKFVTGSFFPFCLPGSDGTKCHDVSVLNVVLVQLFHSPLSLSSRGCLVSVHMSAKSLQLCLTLYNPITIACQASLFMGILQTRILECVTMPSSRGSSGPRNRTHISYISCPGRQALYH